MLKRLIEGSSHYVAHMLSDGQPFDCATVSSEVPIFLKTVYD
jgi:hypothetical protein